MATRRTTRKAAAPAKKAATNKGGRPKAEIDIAEVRQLAAMMFEKKEIAAWIGIHPGSLSRRIKDDPELKAAIEEGREQGKASLRRVQFQKAMDGDKTMLVWLGKQYLGQKDRVEQENRELPALFVTMETKTADDEKGDQDEAEPKPN